MKKIFSVKRLQLLGRLLAHDAGQIGGGDVGGRFEDEQRLKVLPVGDEEIRVGIGDELGGGGSGIPIR